MTIFEKYDNKGELETKTNEPVTTGNLDLFMSSYDPKIVQGYMLALADLNVEVHNVVWDTFTPRTAARVRTMITHFHEEKTVLLEKFQLREIDLPKPSDPPRLVQY